MPQNFIQSTTGLILAGGAGSRMGGRDKGWISVDGTSLVERAIATLEPQVEHICISANRSCERYAQLGLPVFADNGGQTTFGGPLMGILAGMRVLKSDYLLSVPVDAAALPQDLAQRLLNSMMHNDTTAAVVYDGVRIQPLCCLLERSLLSSLERAVAAGIDSPRHWLQDLGAAQADFSDWPQHYWSINTAEELSEVSAQLRANAA